MKSVGLNAAEISFVLAAMMVPWILKPLYGVLSDTVPLFGYRRRSYLIVGHVLALLGLALTATAGAPYVVLIGLMLTALAMAVATALMLGLAAEKGQENGKTARYISAQSFYYYLGNIGAALVGGFLCQRLLPDKALQYSALLALFPIALLTCLTFLMVRENPGDSVRNATGKGWHSIVSAVRNPALWVVGGFAACWNFTPSFGIPLYFQQTNTLHFAQSLIGQLSAWNALGMMLGAVVYRDAVRCLSTGPRLYVVVALWMLSIGSYVLLSTPASGYAIELFRGISMTIEILCMYELAAGFCNTRNSVSVMALILACRNIANELGTIVGGSLFTYVFHNQYYPLILVGLVMPALSLFLVPLMVRYGNGSVHSRA
jgi:predicted MFS family arabinose efflux permease